MDPTYSYFIFVGLARSSSCLLFGHSELKLVVFFDTETSVVIFDTRCRNKLFLSSSYL